MAKRDATGIVHETLVMDMFIHSETLWLSSGVAFLRAVVRDDVAAPSRKFLLTSFTFILAVPSVRGSLDVCSFCCFVLPLCFLAIELRVLLSSSCSLHTSLQNDEGRISFNDG